MAESDPKRFAAHGRPAGGRDLDSEEDPLVELARIVSEDGSFYGSRKSAARRDSQSPARSEPTAADLEAELLLELEASLNGPPGTAPDLGAARRSSSSGFVPLPTEDRTRAAPAPLGSSKLPKAGGSYTDRESQDLLRAIEAQLGDFERRAQDRPPAPQEPKDSWEPPAPLAADNWETSYPDEDLSRHEPDRSSDPDPDPGSWEPSAPPENAPAEAYDEPPADDVGEAESALEVDDQQRGPAPWTRHNDPLGWKEPQVTAADWTRDATRAWEAEFTKSSDQQDREATLPERDAWSGFEAEPVQPAMDWLAPSDDERDKLRGTIAPDFKETKDVAGKGQARNQPASLETRFSDSSLNADWQGASLSRAASPPDEDNDPIPAGVTPLKRKPQADAETPRRGRSGRRLTTVLSLLGVVLLGGAVAYYMRSFDGEVSGPPPVIAAEDGPVKMVPETQAANEAAEAPGAAVYDRVAGTGSSTQETMVDGAEEPREVARIVLPATQAGNGETLTRSVGADAEVNLPKKVRTVVVKADGSVVETVGDAPAKAAAPAPAAAPVAEERPDPNPIQPTPVDTTPVDGNGEVQPGEAMPAEPSPSQAAAPQPAPAVPQQPAAATVVPRSAAPAPAEPAPQQIARTETPVDLLAGAPKAASGEGFHVQLSSQRSEAQALDAFQGLQSRYPSILGSAQPNVQRADLAEKGIYYRLRVGPLASREEAVTMCEQLKAAGGTCFVAR
jgi:hypothetical protein